MRSPTGLREVECDWFEGSSVHIKISNFNRLREALWKAVAADPVLALRFGSFDLSRMQVGKVPATVYVRALLALRNEVVSGRFGRGARVIFVHTGGLQGRRGFGL